jgi:hypothetical protein
VIGANLTGAFPVDADFVVTGTGAVARVADSITNDAFLQTRFPTTIDATGAGGFFMSVLDGDKSYNFNSIYVRNGRYSNAGGAGLSGTYVFVDMAFFNTNVTVPLITVHSNTTLRARNVIGIGRSAFNLSLASLSSFITDNIFGPNAILFYGAETANIQLDSCALFRMTSNSVLTSFLSARGAGAYNLLMTNGSTMFTSKTNVNFENTGIHNAAIFDNSCMTLSGIGSSIILRSTVVANIFLSSSSLTPYQLDGWSTFLLEFAQHGIFAQEGSKVNMNSNAGGSVSTIRNHTISGVTLIQSRGGVRGGAGGSVMTANVIDVAAFDSSDFDIGSTVIGVTSPAVGVTGNNNSLIHT